MGFGSLFIGYFLFLNLTYHGITDIIAALVMLFGLSKLRYINKPFRYCYNIALGFTGFALVALVAELAKMFDIIKEINVFFTITSIVRSILVFALTYFMLYGIIEVAREVDLPKIKEKAKNRVPLAIIVYTLWLVLEVLGLFRIEKIPAVVGLITLLSTVVLIVMNLILIYNCYMQICMPEDLLPKESKKSKLEFVNKFAEHEEEKRREYAEYKLGKIKKKVENLKRKADKNDKK